jgi:hypothetical protein
MDRGEFVRDEPTYDALAQDAGWPVVRKSFSSPRLSSIRYIHYAFSRNAADARAPSPDGARSNASAG